MSASTTRRTPRQSRARSKVEAIVDAARDLLASEGVEAFNTNRIAAEAGVSVGTLYEYFPNKESVALAIIDRVSADETDAVLRRLDPDAELSLDERIGQVVSATMELYWRHAELFRSLWSLTSVARSVGSRPGEKEIAARVRVLLEPHRHELAVDDLDLAVFMVFHTVESLAGRFAEHRRRWSRRVATRETTRIVTAYLLGSNAPAGHPG